MSGSGKGRGWLEPEVKLSVDGASLGKACSVGEGRTTGTTCYRHCLQPMSDEEVRDRRTGGAGCSSCFHPVLK